MMIYLELFLTFFKVGLFTFGGGYAMLPMIREEVISHGWLSQSELIDFLYRHTHRRYIWQLVRDLGRGSAVVYRYYDSRKVLSKIQKQQVSNRRNDRLKACCGRFDSGSVAFAFADRIFPYRTDNGGLHDSTVLCIARYFCGGGRFSFQKAPPDFHNSAFCRCRSDIRIFIGGIVFNKQSKIKHKKELGSHG